MVVCSSCKQEWNINEIVLSDKGDFFTICAECYENEQINKAEHNIENSCDDRGIDNG